MYLKCEHECEYCKKKIKKKSSINIKHTKTFRGTYTGHFYWSTLKFLYWFLYNKLHNNGHRITIF